MAQLASVKHWHSGLDKWTLNTGYYDEWEFHTGNSARYGRGRKARKKFLPKVLPMANWKLMPLGSVDIHSVGFYWILGLA